MNIQISSPCQQDWNKMTTGSEGKFCNACAKNIIDFTNFSDVELQQYFLNFGANSGSICGRFTAEQAVVQRPTVTNNRFLLWCWLGITTLILFFSKQSKAQRFLGEVSAPTEQTVVNKVKKVSVYDQAISLMVKDALGNVLSGIRIYIDNELVAIKTGKDGGVSLLVSKDSKVITLEKENYVTKIISIGTATHFKVELLKESSDKPMIMGKIAIAQPYFKGEIKLDNF